MHRMLPTIFAVLFFSTTLISSPGLAAQTPRQAPEWQISEWINSPGLSLDGLKGKVVIIDFFQLWCPGCNSFSIPLMNHWEQVFKKEVSEKRLVFVSIHTVFEGHTYQNPERLRKFLKEKEIHHAVGVDRQIKGKWLPETMRLYKTRGTPEMAMIDKKGQIRFQNFGFFEPKDGEHIIRTLLKEPG